MPASPRICIYGAGAIGGMIGTLLARAGASVSVVARGETLAALETNGLQLIMGDETLRARVRVSSDPADLGPQDYVIVAVKAPAFPSIARRLAPLLGADTAIVTAMNGLPWWFFANTNGPLAGQPLIALDPDGVIGRVLPMERAIGCAVHVACSRDAPGIIRHTAGRRLLIGEADNRSTPRIQGLAFWLRRAGFDCAISPDIRRDIWDKLRANLVVNPISLLTAATSDRIIDEPLVRALCVHLMEEADRIGESIGVQATHSIDGLLDLIRANGAFKTSMLQDAESGHHVEICALVGVMHDIGRLVGVPTPFVDAVLGLARLRAANLGLLDDAA